MAIQRNLKAFVRYDGSGRVVAGSLILRKNKPKVGRWQEIPAYECCNYVPTSTTTTTSTTASPTTTTTTTASPTTTTTSTSTSTSTTTSTSTSTSTTTTTTTTEAPTTTTTTTAPPSYYSYDVSNVFNGSGPGDACLAEQTIVLYANTNDPLGSLVGNFLYTDTALTTKFTGNPPGVGGYYRYGLTGDPITYRSDFAIDGTINNVTQC